MPRHHADPRVLLEPVTPAFRRRDEGVGEEAVRIDLKLSGPDEGQKLTKVSG